MFGFHEDRMRYFDMQVENTAEYVIPFIEKVKKVDEGLRVLEIGAGEGGVLKAFVDRGCYGVGVELHENKLEIGKQRLKEEQEQNKVRLIAKDIYDADPATDFGGLFDIVILKDVIEHIYDQERLIVWMKTFIKDDGIIFFGFPPWQMPFGGHQQVCKNKFLSILPYYHLLPRFLYSAMLKVFGENPEDLLEIKETGISIDRFEKIIRKTDYTIAEKELFLINPIYKYKFNLKPRKQNKWIGKIPYFRNFVTTCAFYVIKKK